MKALLVVNEAASSVTPRRQVIISKLIAADHDVTVATTHRRDHATRLAQSAALTGTELVVVLGGDGTLNEVVNGLAGTDCAVAALPGGSTNVFARALGLPDDPVEAMLVNLDAIAAGHVSPVALGSVTATDRNASKRRYFAFHVGVGWDAALVEQVERHAEMKRYASHALFIYAGLKTFFGRYDRRHPHFRVIHADGATIADAYFTVVLKLNPYTFVGNRPFNLAPDAGFATPLTSVTVRSMRTPTFLSMMAAALGNGRRLARIRKVDFAADISSLVIEALDASFPYQVDGDYLGTTERLEFEVHPEALRLVVPVSHLPSGRRL